MHDHDTTSGSREPDADLPIHLEQVLTEAAKELPLLTLAGCMVVGAEVMPYAIGHLGPVCHYVSPYGEHRISTPFVWKDMATNEVYCHLRCAALDAIDLASRIATDEGLLRRETAGG